MWRTILKWLWSFFVSTNNTCIFEEFLNELLAHLVSLGYLLKNIFNSVLLNERLLSLSRIYKTLFGVVISDLCIF
jgi:hypothetical protein